jgi:hypothetical protein
MRNFKFLMPLLPFVVAVFTGCHNADMPQVTVHEADRENIARLSRQYTEKLPKEQIMEIDKQIKALNFDHMSLFLDYIHQEELKKLEAFRSNPVIKMNELQEDGSLKEVTRRLTEKELDDMKTDQELLHLRQKFSHEEGIKLYQVGYFNQSNEQFDIISKKSFEKYPIPMVALAKGEGKNSRVSNACPTNTCVVPGLTPAVYSNNGSIPIDYYTNSSAGSCDVWKAWDSAGGDCDYFIHSCWPRTAITFANTKGKELLTRFGGHGAMLGYGNMSYKCANPGGIGWVQLGAYRVHRTYGTNWTAIYNGLRWDVNFIPL